MIFRDNLVQARNFHSHGILKKPFSGSDCVRVSSVRPRKGSVTDQRQSALSIIGFLGSVRMEIETHPVVTLNRYFFWFDGMHKKFKETLSRAVEPPSFFNPDFVINFMYLLNCYAALYVVIEGWNKLKLKDPEVDRLLDSPMVDRLRRVRNGAYHFQPRYFDNRITEFTAVGRPAIDWINAAHSAFEKFFLEWNSTHNLDGSIKPEIK